MRDYHSPLLKTLRAIRQNYTGTAEEHDALKSLIEDLDGEIEGGLAHAKAWLDAREESIVESERLNDWIRAAAFIDAAVYFWLEIDQPDEYQLEAVARACKGRGLDAKMLREIAVALDFIEAASLDFIEAASRAESLKKDEEAEA